MAYGNKVSSNESYSDDFIIDGVLRLKSLYAVMNLRESVRVGYLGGQMECIDSSWSCDCIRLIYDFLQAKLLKKVAYMIHLAYECMVLEVKFS